MRYKIIENPAYTMCCKVGIETNPENEPLKFLLSGLKIKKFPEYISILLEKSGFGEENIWFTFYHEMDWEDKAGFLEYFKREIESDELRIHFYDSKTNYSVMKSDDFKQIFYDYSCKILEVYGNEKEIQFEFEKHRIEILTDDNMWPYYVQQREWYKLHTDWKLAMQAYLEKLKIQISE